MNLSYFSAMNCVCVQRHVVDGQKRGDRPQARGPRSSRRRLRGGRRPSTEPVPPALPLTPWLSEEQRPAARRLEAVVKDSVEDPHVIKAKLKRPKESMC